MTDLTPETLAERRDYWHSKWFYARTDAERAEAGFIVAVMDALAAEKTAREEAERELSTLKRSESFDVATAEARAVKAEREAGAWEATAEKLVRDLRAAEQERDEALTLLREIQEMGTGND